MSKTTPTLRDYLISDTNDIDNIHRIEYDLPAGELATYTIGVYGNPYVPPDVRVKYDIIGTKHYVLILRLYYVFIFLFLVIHQFVHP